MRAYTVATAAVTLRMPAKWLDNALSQHHIDGVVKRRQGIARKLTPRAVVTLDIAVRIATTFGASLPTALRLANELMAQRGDRSVVDAGDGLTLSLDLRQIE